MKSRFCFRVDHGEKNTIKDIYFLSKPKFPALVGIDMKTKLIEYPVASSQSFRATLGASRLANFGRVLVATSCVSLVSFATVPAALAGGANGTYEFKRAYGTLKYGGKSVDIPESIVRRIAGVVQGDVIIRNQKLKLNRNASARIIKNLGKDLDFSVETSVSGPASLELTKTGNSYSGETRRPIVVSFDGNFHGEDFSGELVTGVTATLDNNKLKLVITFSGDALGDDFNGKVVVIARR